MVMFSLSQSHVQVGATRQLGTRARSLTVRRSARTYLCGADCLPCSMQSEHVLWVSLSSYLFADVQGGWREGTRETWPTN
jgi:hypothetical protein